MSFARTKAFVLPVLATLALAGASVASASPMILNGNFSGLAGGYQYQPSSVADWTFTGGTGVQENGSAWGFTNAPNGAGQSAFLQSYIGNVNVPTGNPTSSISQGISSLTVGASYGVSFYLEGRSGYGLNPVTVTIDGVTMTVTPPSDSEWTKYTEYFTYNGNSDTLTFSVTGTGAGNYDNDTGLADVSLGATPEPGTLLLLGTGLLGFAGFARRKLGSKNG